MTVTSSFSAASSKYAYAQAFAGPTARRHTEHLEGRRPVSRLWSRVLLRKHHSA